MSLKKKKNIPYNGFSKKIDVHFYSDNRLPSAATCGLVFNVPRHYEDYQIF